MYCDVFVSESEPENIENTKTTLEDCSITYFAGYLAKRCVDNFNCTYCKNIMLTDKEDIDQNKMLILYKTFKHIDPLSTGGLKMPTNWQINVCRISLKIFENHFQNIKSEVKRTSHQNVYACNAPEIALFAVLSVAAAFSSTHVSVHRALQ